MKFPQWIGLAALTAACLLLWSLRDVLIHLFAAIVLAMAICTLVGSLRERWPIPRGWALLICLLGLVLVVGIGASILVPPFVSQFHQLLLQLRREGRINQALMDQPSQCGALGQLNALKQVIKHRMGLASSIRQPEFHGEGTQDGHCPNTGGNR